MERLDFDTIFFGRVHHGIKNLALLLRCTGSLKAITMNSVRRPATTAVFVLCIVLFDAAIISFASSSAANIIDSEIVYLPAHTRFEHVVSARPHEYLQHVPDNWNWNNVNGTSYLTRMLNQHVPQWCGSCWAHGALSSLADRIKIDRRAQGDDVNLSIQYVLNCGGAVAGSCLGGTHSGAYQFLFEQGFVPYDTCQPYLACSHDYNGTSSSNNFCQYVDTTCTNLNTCKTCSMKLVPSLHPFGQVCREIDMFPNASIQEFGVIGLHNNTVTMDQVVRQIKAEVFARGPVAAAINGRPLRNYSGGVYNDTLASNKTTHIVSIVGWETDPMTNRQAWICRNSWGTLCDFFIRGLICDTHFALY
jgi:cathepsin X